MTEPWPGLIDPALEESRPWHWQIRGLSDGDEAMSDSSSFELFVLIVMAVLYAVEHRWPLAPPEFSIASAILAVIELVLGRWPIGLAALLFALLALRRWRLRRGQTVSYRF
jgi:hypothetical protein